MTIATEPIATPVVKTTADVLRHAALLIEERGWCQNEVSTKDGRLCAWGAIVYRDNWVSPLWSQATGRFADYLGAREDDDPVGIIAEWNDKRSRTAAEVIAALRAAAELA